MPTEEQRQKVRRYARALLLRDSTTRRLVESLAEALVVVDQSGRIVLVNERAEEIFGYDSGGLDGQLLQILLPGEVRDGHQHMLASFFKGPRVRPMGMGLDLQGVRKDGSSVSIEISLSYLQTAVGLLGLAFITDITSRKIAEDQLAEQNRLLDQFAGFVAHDLQSSVAAIQMVGSELASDRGLTDAERDEWVERIIADSNRMLSVIRNLLLLARTRGGDVPLVPVSLERTLNEARYRVRDLIEVRNASIEVELTLPSVQGHAPWIEEVWYNLLSNAVKYGSTPPHVRIRSVPAEESGRVHIQVENDGPGIPPDRVDLVFDAFSRASDDRPGHGLGLAIVASILKRLGGTISVASRPGEWTTFTIELPAA